MTRLQPLKEHDDTLVYVSAAAFMHYHQIPPKLRSLALPEVQQLIEFELNLRIVLSEFHTHCTELVNLAQAETEIEKPPSDLFPGIRYTGVAILDKSHEKLMRTVETNCLLVTTLAIALDDRICNLALKLNALKPTAWSCCTAQRGNVSGRPMQRNQWRLGLRKAYRSDPDSTGDAAVCKTLEWLQRHRNKLTHYDYGNAFVVRDVGIVLFVPNTTNYAAIDHAASEVLSNTKVYEAANMLRGRYLQWFLAASESQL